VAWLGCNQVRDSWFFENELMDSLLQLTVGPSYTVVLPQVFQPRFDEEQVSVFLDPDSVFCFALRGRGPGGLIHLIELGLLDTFFNEPFIVASPLVVLILARTDRNFAAL